MCLVEVDLQTSVNIGCLKYDGFIGGNLMRQAYWKIDYENQILTLTNQIDKLNIPKDAIRIPFHQVLQGTPKLVVNSGDTKLSNVTFDTGMMKSFNFPLSMMAKKEMQKQVLRSNWGYGGKSSGLYGLESADTIKYGVLKKLQMGDLILDNGTVEFNGKKARIGSGLLKNYDVYLNWDSQEIHLVQRKDVKTDSLYSFGFTPRFKDGQMIVSFVYNSLGVENPLKLNDQILEMDGVNYEEISRTEWCDYITTKADETKLSMNIKIRRGDEVLVFDLEKQNYL